MDENFREEDLEALPYVERREKTRQLIEAALQHVEKMDRPLENARYDLLNSAMSCFQERNYWAALITLQRVMSPEMLMEIPNLLDAPEPDRSLPLRTVWSHAQTALEKLEPPENDS